MPDILLIQPPVRDFYLTAKRTLPYGLASIAGGLISAGFSVEIFDALATAKSKPLDLPPEMAFLKAYYARADSSPFALFYRYRHYGYAFEYIGKIARESGAFLIGISSLFTAYGKEALQAAEVVKKYHPGSRVVMGGHHPTAFPREVMTCKAVDFVLRGEGEDSMPLLAKALESDTGVESVPGVVFRKGDGSIQLNPPGIKADLNRASLPALHLIKKKFYRRHGRGAAVIAASRGCPLQCSYCSLGAGSDVKYRRRSVVSVIREIQYVVTRHAVRFIDFEDENLSLQKDWFLDLLSEIKKRFGDKRLELRAMNGLLPSSMDKETVGAMKAAGFKTLNLSLGSTSAEQLKRFRRPDVRKAFESSLQLAEAHGMGAVGYVIAGAPDQRAEVTLKDLLYLASRRVLVGLSVYYPSPGSMDYQLCSRQGILPDHFSLFRSSCLPLTHTTSRIEAVTLLRLARVVNFMKALVDRGTSIPGPRPFNKKAVLDPRNRQMTGLKLLSWFLEDGSIRGVTPDGAVYPHLVDRRLTELFLDGIRRIAIRGSGIGQRD